MIFGKIPVVSEEKSDLGFQFNSGIGDTVLFPNNLFQFLNNMRFPVVMDFFELNHIRIHRKACSGY